MTPERQKQQAGKPAAAAPAPEAKDAPPAGPSCVTCQFFQPVAKAENVGVCRRFPPAAGIVAATAAGPLTAFPVVKTDGWCGEHAKAAPAS